LLPIACLIGLAAGLVTDPDEGQGPPAGEAPDVRFGRDIRPLLSDRCFVCHGADAGSRMADLRLDQRQSAVAERHGGAAIVPGDPDASELLARINHHDLDEVMPPPSAKRRPLTDEDRAALRQWIAEGAVYEEHWAFVAPERPATPVVSREDWARNPLDAFVLSKLEAEGLEPSPQADPETLLRRVFLDLTGLPPEPEEQDAFLADPSDAAYEALVQRLLTEEPYATRTAEHLTSPWLDAARYADTIGIHTDNGRQMWVWRDWVLRALRDGMPYDQFVTEQLAGDLIPDASVDQKVASGFHRNHVITDEGGAIDQEYLVEYAVDRTDTTGAVFLGLTLGCARCHDHKYDPVTQEDYYSLFAFFNSIEEPGLYSQRPSEPERAFEPFLEVPSPEQEQQLARMEQALATLLARLEEPLPGETAAQDAFLADAAADSGVAWTRPEVLSARSTDERVTLELRDDGALWAVGPVPEMEDQVFTLGSDVADLRAVLVELMSLPDGDTPGPGRTFHGNIVLTNAALEQRLATRTAGDDAWQPVPLQWAWADHTQKNRDYEPGQMLDDDPSSGYAADGNEAAGPRVLMLLAEQPFGSADGAELRLTLSYRSPYMQHSPGRVRLSVSPLADASTLPLMAGRWYRVGPFGDGTGDLRASYDASYGPESLTHLDLDAGFGPDARKLQFFGEFADGATVSTGDDLGATFLLRRIWSPDAREVPVSLGSDDGIQVFLNGELVFENRVDRGVGPDQDAASLALQPGLNMLAMKIVNTGGPGGAYWRIDEAEDVLIGELASALLPDSAVTDEQREQRALTWRRAAFDDWRALDDERAETEAGMAEVQSSLPRAMVMKERSEPRQAYVLVRGQYDLPDEQRPVERVAPSFLPPIPEGAPADRRGLAAWLTAPEQPLFARVSVNRFWEQLFGVGLVATSVDFGLQGDWPSHPELLDWLAVDFRESAWDLRGLLTTLVTSATYRQGSATRPELLERDPDDRLLARYPPRRLTAEQIRDLALHASGLLVEQFGGPSVKPYQPEGLWREVSMTQSNTRTFRRDDGEALWRRSLYTYWKRAVPPPALQAFDAPTRESCVVSRQRTNTPLQALVLWNDEQFVEASRALAARTLAEDGDDETRLVTLFRRCTGRLPDADERALLADTLAAFRARYGEDPAAALALLEVGESALPGGAMLPAYAEADDMAEELMEAESAGDGALSDGEATAADAIAETATDVLAEPPTEAGDDPAAGDVAGTNGDHDPVAAALAAWPADAPSPQELAAWTLLSNAALNLHETLTQD
jgi:hypothetical protein